jgi:ArsR family transcriptional regulator, arsenate/arsenite/antimonite-responsive transcriptional repressor
MDQSDVIKALAALAQPVRLDVFRALVVAGPRGMTPSTMADGLGVPASSLSFHLKELTNAGLIVPERASRNLIYRAAFDRMNEVLQYLTQNCCQDAECALDTTAASRGC